MPNGGEGAPNSGENNTYNTYAQRGALTGKAFEAAERAKHEAEVKAKLVAEMAQLRERANTVSGSSPEYIAIQERLQEAGEEYNRLSRETGEMAKGNNSFKRVLGVASLVAVALLTTAGIGYFAGKKMNNKNSSANYQSGTTMEYTLDNTNGYPISDTSEAKENQLYQPESFGGHPIDYRGIFASKDGFDFNRDKVNNFAFGPRFNGDYSDDEAVQDYLKNLYYLQPEGATAFFYCRQDEKGEDVADLKDLSLSELEKLAESDPDRYDRIQKSNLKCLASCTIETEKENLKGEAWVLGMASSGPFLDKQITSGNTFLTQKKINLEDQEVQGIYQLDKFGGRKLIAILLGECGNPVVLEDAGVPQQEEVVQETTEAHTTEASTTEAHTTEAHTTEESTTAAIPTTAVPTTATPTTEAPTTEAPTTEAPTTEAPTTEAPTTEAPTTEAPTTEAPTTEATTEWGKSGDPHTGTDVDPSDRVGTPAPEPTMPVDPGNETLPAPGSDSGGGGTTSPSTSSETFADITAPGSNQEEDETRASGGENQGGGTIAGETTDYSSEQAKDSEADESQSAAQETGGAGGDNHSDEEEESLIEGGDF